MPLVVGIGVIRIQPPIAIIVPLEVEDVRIAIGSGNMPAAVCATTL